MAKRIAIVNDEPDFIEMVSLLLEGEGYEVRACTTGDEALPLIREWRPELVLLDIRMEGLNGWDTLTLMQQDPATHDVRVLVTSGAVEEVSAAKGWLRAQGHDYIALPFDVDEFVAKVKQMVGEPQ